MWKPKRGTGIEEEEERKPERKTVLGKVKDLAGIKRDKEQ